MSCSSDLKLGSRGGGSTSSLTLDENEDSQIMIRRSEVRARKAQKRTDGGLPAETTPPAKATMVSPPPVTPQVNSPNPFETPSPTVPPAQSVKQKLFATPVRAEDSKREDGAGVKQTKRAATKSCPKPHSQTDSGGGDKTPIEPKQEIQEESKPKDEDKSHHEPPRSHEDDPNHFAAAVTAALNRANTADKVQDKDDDNEEEEKPKAKKNRDNVKHARMMRFYRSLTSTVLRIQCTQLICNKLHQDLAASVLV